MILGGASISVAAGSGVLPPQPSFMLLTIALMLYLGVEIRRLVVHQKVLCLLNPALLASILTFGLSFGASNLLYLLPEDLLSTVGLYPEVTEWMNQLMLLVLLGALGMWLGYWSRIGTLIGGRLTRSRLLERILRREYRLRYGFVGACILISLLSRAWMIHLGVYGYSADYARLYELGAYREYLGIGESLGTLALLGAGLQYYAPGERRRGSGSLVLLLLSYEVLSGFLSGFKSQVVVPFIIVGLCAYRLQGRLPRWLFPAVVSGICAAYLVIEPFRAARNRDLGFESTSAVYILDVMLGVDPGSAANGDEGPPLWLSFLGRINSTYDASLGIEFANRGPLPEDSPAFLSNILLSPLHAVIPRLLWEGKPLQNLGSWYNEEVLGHPFVSATGMSPFTYLYFAGGTVAVFLGCFAVGVVQRLWVEGFLWRDSGGSVVYMAGLGGLVYIDSAFDTFFLDLVRLTPLLLLGQYGLFRK